MSRLLSSITGGRLPPKMPKLLAIQGNVKLKTNGTTVVLSNNSAFFTEMALTRGSRSGAQASLINNTNRQTIIDIVSGVSGTLTHVVGATSLGANDVSIFVTASGVETEYKFYNVSTDRPILGGALKINPQIASSTVGTSLLGAADDGWQDPNGEVGLISEDQCIFNGIGIPFTESLKVEIQYSAGVTISGVQQSAAVTYVRD